MINDSSKLKEGQVLKVHLELVKDRLPKSLFSKLENNPNGKLVGFKMVDGNQFGLVLKFEDGITDWFFEEELSEIENIPESS